MINISQNEVSKELYDLCVEIARLPQTDDVVDIGRKANSILKLASTVSPRAVRWPALILATFAWCNVFAFGWLVLFRILRADWLSLSMFSIFFVVSVFSSAIYSSGNTPKPAPKS